MKLLVLALVFASFVTSIAEAEKPMGGPGGKRRHRMGPPPEALAACKDKTESAECGFTHEGHEIKGTCFMPSEGKPLACKPAGKDKKA